VATAITASPVALVSLVEDERLHFRGHVGLPEPFASLREAPLTNSFCEHVLETGEPLVVNDARQSALHQQKPAFRQLGVVAYLGVPLKTPSGVTLGTLCLIDTQPRTWTPEALAQVRDVARSVLIEIELRAALESVRGIPFGTAAPAPTPAAAPATSPDLTSLYETHAPAVYGLLLTLADAETAERLLTATFQRAGQRMAGGGGLAAPTTSAQTPEATSAWLGRLALGQAQRAGLFAFPRR